MDGTVNTSEPTSAVPSIRSREQQRRASRRSLVKASIGALVASVVPCTPLRAHSQQAATPVAGATTPSTVLFRDVRIFDGMRSSLSAPASVLVRGNTIATIAEEPTESPSGATVIDGGGRTLMPGLIDAH